MVEDLSKKRLALLGLGKMGSILLQALLKQKVFLPKNSVATVRHPGRAKKLSDELGIDGGTDNRAATQNADIVLICVKPQTVRKQLAQGRFPLRPVALRRRGRRVFNLWDALEARAAAAGQIEVIAKTRGGRWVG